MSLLFPIWYLWLAWNFQSWANSSFTRSSLNLLVVLSKEIFYLHFIEISRFFLLWQELIFCTLGLCQLFTLTELHDSFTFKNGISMNFNYLQLLANILSLIYFQQTHWVYWSPVTCFSLIIIFQSHVFYTNSEGVIFRWHI